MLIPPEGDPKGELKGRPLQVVLHQMGGTADSVLKQSFNKGGWFHIVGLKEHYVLYLDCKKNKNDNWWGAQNDLKGKYKDAYAPTEKRILTTIEWVIEKYQIDRDCVYLSGISMGGSGSLGIGMGRGDIFAAVNVTVPAGVDHVMARLFDRSVPDPPVLVNSPASETEPPFSRPPVRPDGWLRGLTEKPTPFTACPPLLQQRRDS